MESMTTRDFYLSVSEPMELPPHEYLIVLNVDAKPEQLDEVDQISGWSLDDAALKEIDQLIHEKIMDPIGPEFMAPPI